MAYLGVAPTALGFASGMVEREEPDQRANARLLTSSVQ
jgi:hypothetical protein